MIKLHVPLAHVSGQRIIELISDLSSQPPSSTPPPMPPASTTPTTLAPSRPTTSQSSTSPRPTLGTATNRPKTPVVLVSRPASSAATAGEGAEGGAGSQSASASASLLSSLATHGPPATTDAGLAAAGAAADADARVSPSGGLTRVPTIDELLSCVTNRDDIDALLIPKGPTRRERAAILIQATWKMYVCRKYYMRDRRKYMAARVIQRAWASYRQHQHTRRAIVAAWQMRLASWRLHMDEFKTRWARVHRKRRVIVHIPSLSYTHAQRRDLHNFNVRENRYGWDMGHHHCAHVCLSLACLFIRESSYWSCVRVTYIH
jgi:hypothetical protein